MFSNIKWPLRLNQVLFEHVISVAPCILISGGVGRGGGAKELKGFVQFLGAVVSQFSMGMVCCTRTAINYGYFIAIRRVFREPFEPSASG